MTATDDRWLAGDAYEAFMGRWSRPLARTFVEWLNPERAAHWLDVGCGTGALASAICDLCEPASVVAWRSVGPGSSSTPGRMPSTAAPPSSSQEQTRCRSEPADSTSSCRRSSSTSSRIPLRPSRHSASISDRAVRQRPASGITPTAWNSCGTSGKKPSRWTRGPLPTMNASAFRCAGDRHSKCCSGLPGSGEAVTGELTIRTDFASFDDYWTPLLKGTGPAPGYVASLDPQQRLRLRERLRRRLDRGGGSTLRLSARAWVVRAVRTELSQSGT